MATLSQDIVENSFPFDNPITAELLRVRANSSSKKKSPLASRLSGSEYEFESFTGGVPSVESWWRTDKRELGHR